MIIQLIVANEPVTVFKGVRDYETSKHHTTLITNNGLVEVPVRSYDYFTVQIEDSDLEEAVEEHVPTKKRIGFIDGNVALDEGGEPLEPAIGDLVEDYDEEDEEDYEKWLGGSI